MKKNIILKGAALLVVVFAVLSLVSCDEWINIDIIVQNNIGLYESSRSIEAWIEYDDGHDSLPSKTIADNDSESFHFTYFDMDKYTEVTFVVYDGGIHRTTGNVAENDWWTVVRYPEDF